MTEKATENVAEEGEPMNEKEIQFERNRGAREFAEKLKVYLEKNYGFDWLNDEIDKLLK